MRKIPMGNANAAIILKTESFRLFGDVDPGTLHPLKMHTCKRRRYCNNKKMRVPFVCLVTFLMLLICIVRTFADAYADVNTGNLITTVSFKIVDTAIDSSSFDSESTADAFAV